MSTKEIKRVENKEKTINQRKPIVKTRPENNINQGKQMWKPGTKLGKIWAPQNEAAIWQSFRNLSVVKYPVIHEKISFKLREDI